MNHTKMPVVYRHFLFHEKAYTIYVSGFHLNVRIQKWHVK